MDGQYSAAAVWLTCKPVAGTHEQVMKDEEALEGHAWLMFEGDEYLEPSPQWRAFSLPVRRPLNGHPTEPCAIEYE